MPRDTNLSLAVLALHTGRDLLALPLQDDLPLSILRQLIKASAELAEEITELLLCHVRLGDGTTLNGLLDAEESELYGVRLGEDSGGCLALLGGGLGLNGMGCTVGSAGRHG